MLTPNCASEEDRKPRESLTRSFCGRLSVANGLLCPDCNRAIQTYDFDSIDRSAFRINCGGCHRTLLAYEE
jgi:hypothetical protein